MTLDLAEWHRKRNWYLKHTGYDVLKASRNDSEAPPGARVILNRIEVGPPQGKKRKRKKQQGSESRLPEFPEWRKKVAVIGPVTFDNPNFLWPKLDKFLSGLPDPIILSDGTRERILAPGIEYQKYQAYTGVAFWAETWAIKNLFTHIIFNPDPEKDGDKAIEARYHKMIRYADFVVVFDNGTSNIAVSAQVLAGKLKKQVRVVEYEEAL